MCCHQQVIILRMYIYSKHFLQFIPIFHILAPFINDIEIAEFFAILEKT